MSPPPPLVLYMHPPPPSCLRPEVGLIVRFIGDVILGGGKGPLHVAYYLSVPISSPGYHMVNLILLSESLLSSSEAKRVAS